MGEFSILSPEIDDGEFLEGKKKLISRLTVRCCDKFRQYPNNIPQWLSVRTQLCFLLMYKTILNSSNDSADNIREAAN